MHTAVVFHCKAKNQKGDEAGIELCGVEGAGVGDYWIFESNGPGQRRGGSIIAPIKKMSHMKEDQPHHSGKRQSVEPGPKRFFDHPAEEKKPSDYSIKKTEGADFHVPNHQDFNPGILINRPIFYAIKNA